jgi:hypothetical protein
MRSRPGWPVQQLVGLGRILRSIGKCHIAYDTFFAV